MRVKGYWFGVKGYGLGDQVLELRVSGCRGCGSGIGVASLRRSGVVNMNSSSRFDNRLYGAETWACSLGLGFRV